MLRPPLLSPPPPVFLQSHQVRNRCASRSLISKVPGTKRLPQCTSQEPAPTHCPRPPAALKARQPHRSSGEDIVFSAGVAGTLRHASTGPPKWWQHSKLLLQLPHRKAEQRSAGLPEDGPGYTGLGARPKLPPNILLTLVSKARI
jgi:hypothetical protein